MLPRVSASLHRFAEGIAAALMAVIFVAFIIQIALRYLFNWPVGWTSELSVAAWLWLVLWGAAFVLKDDEEIRIDLLVERVGRKWILAITGPLSALTLVIVAFVVDIPTAAVFWLPGIATWLPGKIG